MAVNISFKLRTLQKEVTPAKQKDTPIIMMVNFGYFEWTPSGKKTYKPLKYATGEKIKPNQWNLEKDRAKQSAQIDFQNLNTRLDNLETYAKTAIQELVNNQKILTSENVKSQIDQKNPYVENTQARVNNFNEYIKFFIEEIENGIRLSPNKQRYSKGTIKNFKGFRAQFDNFQKENRKAINFHHVTLDFYDDFVNFFVRKNYSPNTIGRHIKNLKTLMRYSRDEGLHDNIEIDRRKFKVLRVDVDNIYLEESEVKTIYELDLSDKPHLDLARDVFLVGCYTAQRFSDYSRISHDHIQTRDDGRKMIRLTQQKTNELVIIPVKHELEAILKKHNWDVPKIWEQKLNKHIKTVGKIAKINATTSIEGIKGGLKIKKQVPKYDLIKTHTARRTGCTNMYLQGIPSLDIMKVSGHKTEREFLKYIKVTKEETAKNLINHPYFSTAPMKVAK